MGGECGEALNLIKKMHRGDLDVDIDDIGRELADLVIYADLLAARLGLDLGEEIRLKFNEVSEKKKARERLPGAFRVFDRAYPESGSIRLAASSPEEAVAKAASLADFSGAELVAVEF